MTYDPSKSFQRHQALKRYIKVVKKIDKKSNFRSGKILTRLGRIKVRMLDEIDECFDEEEKKRRSAEIDRFNNLIRAVFKILDNLLDDNYSEEAKKTAVEELKKLKLL